MLKPVYKRGRLPAIVNVETVNDLSDIEIKEYNEKGELCFNLKKFILKILKIVLEFI